jgi:uncharacterized protein YjbI with pentapeptide repeats
MLPPDNPVAVLEKGRWTRLDFSGAVLKDARLEKANLRGADLRAAHLSNCTMQAVRPGARR